MRNVVLDTNVLIDGARDEHSASWRILNDVLARNLVAWVSPQLRREYERILARGLTDTEYRQRMTAFLDVSQCVPLPKIPRVVREDPEDDKVLATAITAGAEALVSSDKHLLDLDPYDDLRILTPQQFNNLRAEDDSSGWSEFARMIGIHPQKS